MLTNNIWAMDLSFCPKQRAKVVVWTLIAYLHLLVWATIERFLLPLITSSGFH